MRYEVYYRSFWEIQADAPYRLFAEGDDLEDAKQIAFRLAFRDNEVYIFDNETQDRVKDY